MEFSLALTCKLGYFPAPFSSFFFFL